MLKSAIFIDFDNIYICLQSIDPRQADYFASSPLDWLKNLEVAESGEQRKFLVRRCYLNPKTFGVFRPYFISSAFDVIDCPVVTAQGKTASDMHILIDVLEKLNHTTRFDEFILFSADADFTPLLKKIREHDRKTCIVLAGPASSAYKASADYHLEIGNILRKKVSPTIQDDFSAFIQTNDSLELNSSILVTDYRNKIIDFLLKKLNQSETAISSAKIIELLRDQFGEQANNWFGYGKANLLFSEIGIESVGLSFDPNPPGRLLLIGKHPAEVPTKEDWTQKEPNSEIVSIARKVCRLTETPSLSPMQFLDCFTYISKLLQESSSKTISILSKSLRDFASDRKIPLARSDATGIIYLLVRNGLDLETSFTVEQIISAYASGIKFQCACGQWELTDEEEKHLLHWLGSRS
jgi:hypothetical protein